MNLMALGFSGLGLLSTLFGVAVYFAKVKQNRPPVRPFALITALLGGIVLGSTAIFLAVPASVMSVLPIALLSAMPIFMGLLFLWLFSQRHTPIGDIKVRIGDQILPFKVQASDGKTFTAQDLKGKRTLFKFYRGSWCPYCSAELKMFEQMKPELDRLGVQVVALSGDTVVQAQAHKSRDNISYTMLSDPRLTVVKTYGVEHQKTIGADSENIMTVFGLPFPMPNQLKFKSMSIPTSLLIDENGVITWIDQSEDYRLRASEERTLSAIKRSFGEGSIRSS